MLKDQSKFVSKSTYAELCSQLIGKRTRFKSDCEFFPNFDVIGLVKSIDITNHNEYLIHIQRNGKMYDIGSHMKNLSYEVL